MVKQRASGKKVAKGSGKTKASDKTVSRSQRQVWAESSSFAATTWDAAELGVWAEASSFAATLFELGVWADASTWAATTKA